MSEDDNAEERQLVVESIVFMLDAAKEHMDETSRALEDMTQEMESNPLADYSFEG